MGGLLLLRLSGGLRMVHRRLAIELPDLWQLNVDYSMATLLSSTLRRSSSACQSLPDCQWRVK